MNGYQIVNEAINHHQEFLDVKDYRKSHPYIYLYHGTGNEILEKIKKEGLNTKYMGEYNRHVFGNALKDLNMDPTKNYLSFTSVKRYALRYSYLHSKPKFFSKVPLTALLCKLTSNHLICTYSSTGFPFGLTDEYWYDLNIPPKDIFFPDTKMYRLIERKEGYLKNN